MNVLLATVALASVWCTGCGKASPNTSTMLVVTKGVVTEDTREKLEIGTDAHKQYQLESKKVAEEGADAKVTLHVVDQSGNDVTNADVSIVFFCNNRKETPILGKTDTNGLFAAEDRLTGNIIYSVRKKGYYETYSKFGLNGKGVRCFQNGRWIPWNPTFQITLKEMRKPIPMIAKKAKIKIPKKNQPFGFDFEVGDLVEPYGKGKHSDIMLKSFGDKPFPLNRNFSETLVFQAENSLGGFIRKNKDDWSALISDNEAPESGYMPEINFFTTSEEGKPVVEDNLSQKEYMIFRSRPVMDENGNLKSALYGKIYGRLTHGINSNDREGAGATILYYFNPTPNDRSLEFDGKNNLLKDLSSLEEVYTP